MVEGLLISKDLDRYMDNSQSNVWTWVIGIAVVVLVALGIWWATGAGATPGTSTTATTTPNGAATTTPGGQTVVSETRSGNVASVAASVGSSRFASLMSSTGVSASLTGSGPYTIFVPNDEAYSASASALSGLSAAQLKRIAQYHVVSGKQLDVDAVSAGTHMALSKDTINFNVRAQDKSAFVNSAYVVRQYKASNGIVYVIGGSMLLPPQTADSDTGSTGTPTPDTN